MKLEKYGIKMQGLKKAAPTAGKSGLMYRQEHLHKLQNG